MLVCFSPPEWRRMALRKVCEKTCICKRLVYAKGRAGGMQLVGHHPSPGRPQPHPSFFATPLAAVSPPPSRPPRNPASAPPGQSRQTGHFPGWYGRPPKGPQTMLAWHSVFQPCRFCSLPSMGHAASLPRLPHPMQPSLPPPLVFRLHIPGP